MKHGRFERRLVLALLVAALAPIPVALWLANLLADDSVALGLNPRIEQALGQAVAVYPQLFRAKRREHGLRADLLARDPALDAPPAETRAHLEALCNASPELLRVAVSGEGLTTVARRCTGRAQGQRELALTRRSPGGRSVSFVFGMPEATFEAFREAEALSKVYRQLGQRRDEVKRAYFLAFLALLGGWALLAAGGGLWLARRTTRRILALVEATRRVSSGDLDARVEVSGQDEIADLAAAFNRMVEEIRERGERIVYLEKISSWQEIARRLAHEIKNPLTPIQLSVQQLESRYDGTDPKFRALLDQVVEIVREEVETLRRLVSEFSEFARLPNVDPEPQDLGRWVEEFVRQKTNLPEGTALEVELPERPLVVPFDRTLLRRVLVNLIENAVQASEGTGRHPRIRLAVRQENGRALLKVEDWGPGIPTERLSRIFDPYFTTKETGTGLGLAICKKIVLQHGGELSASNRSEGGACFEIRLPLALE
ncbi:MAG: HAMP domain-containing protein [Deltaproteobacteria bacterium]|nr:MAG: HAMP domain-containing protein [Deltaproteobacteria bacterium]